jgi:hypothetical protein
VSHGVDGIGTFEISRQDFAEFQMFIRFPLAVFFILSRTSAMLSKQINYFD